MCASGIEVPAGDVEYRLDLTTTRISDDWRSGTVTRTSWSFRSGAATDTTLRVTAMDAAGHSVQQAVERAYLHRGAR